MSVQEEEIVGWQTAEQAPPEHAVVASEAQSVASAQGWSLSHFAADVPGTIVVVLAAAAVAATQELSADVKLCACAFSAAKRTLTDRVADRHASARCYSRADHHSRLRRGRRARRTGQTRRAWTLLVPRRWHAAVLVVEDEPALLPDQPHQIRGEAPSSRRALAPYWAAETAMARRAL